MLSRDDLLTLYERLSISDEARSIIDQVRSSDPARRFRSGRGNVSGRYPSKKMGVTIQFESHRVELAAIYEMERDAHVLEYFDQPPSIKLLYDSANNRRSGGRASAQCLRGCTASAFCQERALVPDRPRQIHDAVGKASRGYPSVTAKAFTAASEVRAAPDEARIRGFVGARVSGIGFRNCRAEWLREPRLHQAGIPRSLPGHRPEARSTKENRNERQGRGPESCAGRRLAAHSEGYVRKAGFRVSWSSAAKLSGAIPSASWETNGLPRGPAKAVVLT